MNVKGSIAAIKTAFEDSVVQRNSEDVTAIAWAVMYFVGGFVLGTARVLGLPVWGGARLHSLRRPVMGHTLPCGGSYRFHGGVFVSGHKAIQKNSLCADNRCCRDLSHRRAVELFADTQRRTDNCGRIFGNGACIRRELLYRRGAQKG